MDLKIVRQQRGVKILVDGEHLKTVPFRFEGFVKNHFDKLNLERKRLNDEERKIFLAAYEFAKFLSKIETNEKHLHRLIATAYPVDARQVITKEGKRFELVLDNNLKIKCTEKMYFIFSTTSNVIHSNY